MPSLPFPRLALIADRFTTPERADRAVAAVRAGVRWVHLRDHTVDPEAFEAAAEPLTSRLREIVDGGCVTINTQLDAARRLHTGLHVGRRGPSVGEARAALGADALIGYSAHEEAEATAAQTQESDYFFFSPVFETDSKPDADPTGVDGLRSFCRAAAPMPVLALGGVTPERVPACQTAGAAGVAVLSGIMEADAPAAATRAYLQALAAGQT